MPVFGHTADDRTRSSLMDKKLEGSVYTTPEECIITSITAKLQVDGTAKIGRAMVYGPTSQDDTEPFAWTLIATSLDTLIPVDADFQWRTFNFASDQRPTLDGNTEYLFAVYIDAGAGKENLAQKEVAAREGYARFQTGVATCCPNPGSFSIGDRSTVDDLQPLIYVTYEVASSPTSPTESASGLWPREYFISGYLPRYQKRQIVGYHSASGDLREIEVNASGHLFVDVEVEVSSGQHVVVSGQPVNISGGHVYVESGAYGAVEIQSGGVIDVREYGWHILSGEWRRKAVCNSGEMVVCSGLYVVADIAESGIGVQVQSGLHVIMSGQHVFVESGIANMHGYHILSGEWRPVRVCDSGEIVVCSGLNVVIESGIGVTATVVTDVSGQPIHVGCADTIRTGRLVQVLGGTSGSIVASGNTGSGGMSLCVSGYWCSGPIHTIVVKNLADNDPVYIGETNCKPYSGYGFLLAATEAINLDYCDVCDVYVFAMTSGQFVTWIGTDY